MVEAPARPRLSPVQRVLVAALGVLIITVQVMLVFAYRNLGKTTVTYGTATDVVTGLARVQRETLELAIELERLRLPDGLDKLAVRRGLLDQQIEVTLGSVPPGGVEREGLERARQQLKSFDAELARLRADPTPCSWLARGPSSKGTSMPSRSRSRSSTTSARSPSLVPSITRCAPAPISSGC
jgi:hypothetical protein